MKPGEELSICRDVTRRPALGRPVHPFSPKVRKSQDVLAEFARSGMSDVDGLVYEAPSCTAPLAAGVDQVHNMMVGTADVKITWGMRAPKPQSHTKPAMSKPTGTARIMAAPTLRPLTYQECLVRPWSSA